MQSERRPGPDEYAPYYGTYVSKVPDRDILELLEAQRVEIGRILDGVDEAQGAHRYAPGKWSVKEVIGHCIDTERVFASRALAFARRDPADLPGFEQDDYVAEASFDARPTADLVAELDVVRRSTIAFFAGLAPETWTHGGIANGSRMSVRAAAYVIHGHLTHHVGVLKSLYLSEEPAG